jgi:hypothetical protein
MRTRLSSTGSHAPPASRLGFGDRTRFRFRATGRPLLEQAHGLARGSTLRQAMMSLVARVELPCLVDEWLQGHAGGTGRSRLGHDGSPAAPSRGQNLVSGEKRLLRLDPEVTTLSLRATSLVRLSNAHVSARPAASRDAMPIRSAGRRTLPLFSPVEMIYSPLANKEEGQLRASGVRRHPNPRVAREARSGPLTSSNLRRERARGW